MPPKRKAVSFAVDGKQPKTPSPSLTLRRSARHIAKKQKPTSSASSPSSPKNRLATAAASSLETTPASPAENEEENSNSSSRTNGDEKTLPVSDEEEYEAMLQSVPKLVTTKQRARSMMVELLRRYPISKYQVFELLEEAKKGDDIQQSTGLTLDPSSSNGWKGH